MKKRLLFLMLCITLLLSGCQKTPETPPAVQAEKPPWETELQDVPLSYADYFAELRTYDTADYAYTPVWMQTGDYEIDCGDGELALYRASDGERLAVYAEQPILSWRMGSDGVYVFRAQDILRCAYAGSQTETLYAAQDGTIISFATAGDVLFFAEKTAYRIRLCRLYAPEERLDVLYDAVSPDAEDFLLFPVSNHELCWSMDNPAFLKLAAEQKQTYIETRNLDPDDQSTYWGMLELDFDVNSGIRYYYNDLTQEFQSQEFRIIYGDEGDADWWKTEDSSRRGAPPPDAEHTLGGISVWDEWDSLPQSVTEGFAELGVVGVSREDYNVVKYGRDGLYVHVLRLQESKDDTWPGLDGSVSCVYTTSPDYPTPRGLRVGDPEASAAETIGALWGSFEYELTDGVISRMGFFSYYDAGGPGEAFTVRPADYQPGN
mgnify:CR=1 FL=1